MSPQKLFYMKNSLKRKIGLLFPNTAPTSVTETLRLAIKLFCMLLITFLIFLVFSGHT